MTDLETSKQHARCQADVNSLAVATRERLKQVFDSKIILLHTEIIDAILPFRYLSPHTASLKHLM